MLMRSTIVLAMLVFLVDCQRPDKNQQAIGALEDRVKKLEDDASFDKLASTFDSIAFLKTSETAYTMTKADFGNVAVSVNGVSDYADGAKIIIRMGNMTSANINGLKAKIDWGQLDDDGSIKGSEKTKEIEFTGDLPAGSWHNFDVILPGLAANKLGWVRVSQIAHSGLSLSNR